MGGNNMFNTTYFVVILSLVILVFVIVKNEVKKSEKTMDKSNFAVRQSKIFLWIGIICTVFFFALLMLMTMFPNDTAEWPVYLIFSLFAFLGLCLTFYCFKWKLEVEGNQIIFSPVTGGKTSFGIDHITKVKFSNGQKITAYNENKKLFSVESNCRGFNVLVSRLRNEQIHFEE
jgi:hypothetical protein